MMRKNIFFLTLLLVAASCGQVKVTPAPQFDGGPLASPCLLEQASNTVILRDYFPTLPSMDTLVLEASVSTPWLQYFDIDANGQKAALVLKNHLPKGLRIH